MEPAAVTAIGSELLDGDGPVRICIRCKGNTQKAGFGKAVDLLILSLGELAPTDGGPHGPEHALVVKHGSLTAFVSVVGDKTVAAAALAQCTGEFLVGSPTFEDSYVTVPACPDRLWNLSAQASMEPAAAAAKYAKVFNVSIGAREIDWDAVAARSANPAAAAAAAPPHAPSPSAVASSTYMITTAATAGVFGAPGGGDGAATAAGAGAGTTATVDSDAPGPAVMLCGVRDSVNIGGAYRLMACFNFPRLMVVDSLVSHAVQPKAAKSVSAASKGCEAFVSFEQHLIPGFLEQLDDPVRPPIVAIETASNAESIVGFDWPEKCSIMVGSEGTGIPNKIIRKLRPGFDRLVIIPMMGPHKSLNVSHALGIALFDYRRQWPGPTLPMVM